MDCSERQVHRNGPKIPSSFTRNVFSISCAKGLMTLPEFDEDYDTAREFCNCIYDEADDKSLAMEDLLTNAGKDISEACRHIVYP